MIVRQGTTCAILVLLSGLCAQSVCAVSEHSCDDTGKVIGLCAGGLKETTIRDISIKLGSARYEKKSELVGAIVDLIIKDEKGRDLPVLEILNGYWKCVSEVLNFSNMLSGVVQAVASTDVQKVIAENHGEIENAINETFTESAIVKEKIVQMTSVDMKRSIDATNALDTKIVLAKVSKSKTEVQIFAKDDQIDPGFSYPKLLKIFKDKGFSVSQGTVDLVNSKEENLVLARKSPVNSWHRINAVWFSEKATDFESVKALSLVLIAAGAQIYSIQPYCIPGPTQKGSPRHNKNLIQVGAFPDVAKKIPYSVEDLIGKNLKDFPRIDKCV